MPHFARTVMRHLRSRSALTGLLLVTFILAAIGVALTITGHPRGSQTAAFSAGIAALALLLLWPLRLSVRLSERIDRVDRRLEKDRKDASRWEWRLSEQVREIGGIGPSPAAAPVQGADSSSGSRSWKNNPLAANLIATGFFDAKYYAQVSGGTFARDLDAASHFLGVGMEKMQSCTPLIDPNRLPREVQGQWKRGDIRSVVRYLQRPRTTLVPLSAFFFPRIMAIQTDATQKHPGGCVGWFVSNADDDDFLPTEEHAIRWKDFKTAVARAIDEHAETKRVGRRRTTSSWDAVAEARWKAELRAWASDQPVESPLMSVIIPMWNREETIGDALDSVRAQTAENWEAIVVDDGSTDASRDVVRRYSRVDPRIKLIESDHRGVCAARNKGLQHSEGDLIAFLDSDNTWEPEFLELMADGMRRDAAEVAYGAIEMRGDEHTLYRAFKGDHSDLMVLNHIDLNVLVISRRRAIEIGGFDESLRRWVDHDFALRATETCQPLLLPFIGCRYDNSESSANRITTTESDNWQWVALARSWVKWQEVREGVPARVPGRVSVVIPTYRDHEMTIRAVRAVLNTTHGHDIEIMVVDNGSDLTTTLLLQATFASEARVRVIRIPRNMNFAIGSNIGAARSTGEYIFFLNNDTEVRPGWLTPMIDRLTDPAVHAVQPLLTFPDDSIQSAGTVFVARDSLPVPFLVGMPPEDARRVGDLEFSALTAAAMLMRASTFAKFEGFDPLFVNGMEDIDLCLRMKSECGGHLLVEPDSRVRHWESRTPGRGAKIEENRALFMERWRGALPDPEHHLYAAVGLEIAHIGGDGLSTPAPRVRLRKRPSAPRRWGIRYSAVGGERGDTWGDTAFVESLGACLRDLGQDVVTYRHGANTFYEGSVDDVNLVIRGIDHVSPIPGQINILWVISHPEDVTLTELRSFDLVYAASLSWAAEMTERSGRPVLPLLQATDVSRFHPLDDDPPITRPATFVGSVHVGRRRGVVEDALAARIPLTVIGSGWRDRLTPDILEREYVPNHQLPDVYRSATRVLADHWPLMARLGFIQNRVFDAVACGSRVITDPVPGLTDVFGDAVQEYRSIEDLRRLSSPAADSLFPSPDEMRSISLRIVEEHSFSARAQRFVEDVEKIDGNGGSSS